ncbi:MAG: hypothetical protein M1828_001407 [Chrysothrix sp. TS-e1954]|nr:MAG: hypothetical protein M1828_001407 [Chrysothrix sp. TS-e1954]
MAAEVKPTEAVKLPDGPSTLSPEQRYWRSFKNQLQIPSLHSTPITHISYPGTSSFNETSNRPAPETFAVTSGGLKTISRLSPSETAYSGVIRPDSRILASAADSGTIQCFEINSRAILKTYKQHKQPVHKLAWNPRTLTQLLSFGDDKSIRLWDLSENEAVTTFYGHQDYIRTGAFLPSSANSGGLFVSGCYDQTTRLWDTRAPQQAAMVFKHASPVESVLPLPSGSTLLASAGNSISVLDLVAARPLTTIRAHQKTITDLSLASGNTRVLSAGLDGHVKVYDTASWSVVAGLKYPAPVLSMATIPSTSPSTNNSNPPTEDSHLAIGLTTGILTIRTRLSGPQKSLQKAREAEISALASGTIATYDAQKRKKDRLAARTSGVRKRLRGMDYQPSQAEEAHIVLDGVDQQSRPKKLQPWDRALRKLRYAEALDLALAHVPSDPKMVLTVLTALVHKSALRTALKARDEVTVRPILKWVIKHLADSRFVELIVRVATCLLELYGAEFGEAKLGIGGLDGEAEGANEIAILLKRLHDKVRGQVEGSQAAWATKGMLEMVMLGAG